MNVELDTETGLYYYGARYLDPKYSRWLSGDPAITDYMAGSSAGEGGIYNTVNLNAYHYGGNNPIRYTDPTGMWIDNDDGTYTAEKGDTLYSLYGEDWQKKSGFTREPKTLQIGESIGQKNSQDVNGSNVQQQISQEYSQKIQNPIEISKSYDFSKWSYVPVEGIGVLGGARFTGSIIMSDKVMSIFASGFLVAQNVVDDYVFFGDATLFVDGNKVGKSYFQYPNYPFIANGPPFSTIGDAGFNYDFSNANSVDVELHFRARISVDSCVNRRFINYSTQRIKVK